MVNLPQVVFGTLPDAYVGQAYTFTFTVDAVFGVSEAGLTVKAGETVLTADGSDSFNIRVNGLVREIKHGDVLILGEGDTFCPVSHTVVLR